MGAVLGLSYEKIDKKLPFEQFKDKIVNYIGREFENGDDIVCIIRTYTDPMKSFLIKNKPEDLTDT